MDNCEGLQVGKVEFSNDIGLEKEKYIEGLQRTGRALTYILEESERDKMKKEFLQREKELNKREEELNKKELKLKAMEIMNKRGVPYELLDVLNYDDTESLNKALDIIKRCVEEKVFFK